jgi:glutamyl-tRNA synthetase
VVVIDDMTMNINTVIRGDDHVMNTPKQILLYQALGSSLPVFGHVPMVLGPDRARFSKRHGAISVTDYRDMGFLPDAMLNYLVRLGWSHGDQEFFTRDELIEVFDIEHIGKLLSLNADHIQATPSADLVTPLQPFTRALDIDLQAGPYAESVIDTLKPRSKTLKDMAEQTLFYYKDDITYEEKAARKVFKPVALEPLRLLAEKLEALANYTEENLEAAFKEVMEQTGLKLGKIAQPVRVALTGKTASPGIFEITAILGKERVISRLQKAIRFIESKQV